MTQCIFPVSNAATLTGIVTACGDIWVNNVYFLGDFRNMRHFSGPLYEIYCLFLESNTEDWFGVSWVCYGKPLLVFQSPGWFHPYLLRHIGFCGFRYHRRSYVGPYIAIDHLLTGTYRGHMPKFGLKFQKLNEILRFLNFEIKRFFPLVDTLKSAYLAQFLRYRAPLLDLVLIFMFSKLCSTTN